VFCEETLNSVINSVLVAWIPPSPDINLLVFYLSGHLKNDIDKWKRGVGFRIFYKVSVKQRYVKNKFSTNIEICISVVRRRPLQWYK